MCFITLLTSATSLLLPTNHFLLFAYIAISFIHWSINKKRLYSLISEYKESLSLPLVISIAVVLTSIAFYISFLSDSFDPEYYHLQNIRWNEEFSVIPGLANLEDRFGFNSNYFLLSALFSGRFMFGEAIHSLQGLLLGLMTIWAFISLIKHKGSVLWIVYIGFLITLFIGGDSFLNNSSTDIIPLLCTFYYISKTVLIKDWITKQPLLSITLPITLVTYKLSSALFCIVCIYALYILIKQSDKRKIIFIISTGFCLILLWCIRNVIISGFLVYPIYAIDLFDVDWKIPKAAAILQEAYIKDWAILMSSRIFSPDLIIDELNGTKIRAIYRITSILIQLFAILSPIVIILGRSMKKAISADIYIIYLTSVASIIFGLIFAPDFRFINGFIVGCSFISIYLLLTVLNIKDIRSLKIQKIIFFALIVSYVIIAIKERELVISYTFDHYKEKLQTALYKPLPHPRRIETNIQFDKYMLDDITIYISKEEKGKALDVIPATNATGLPTTPFNGNKVQNIITIENRGNRLQDGFRTKKEYIDTLNNNVGKYKAEYNKIFNEKYYMK